MNCTRPLLALTIGGALLASLATAAQPALAASPTSAAASAATAATAIGDDSSSTDDISVNRSSSTVIVTVAAPTGTMVTVTGADGKALAGSTARGGSARAAIAAPAVTTTLTVTTPTGTIGTVTLAGSSGSALTAPTIAATFNDGKRGAATVKGMPGAIVAVRDQGKLIGTRMIGTSGTVSVPLPASTDVDRTLDVTQSLEGLVSESKQMDWLAAPKIEVGRVTPDAAILTFVTALGTNFPFSITDASGAEVDWGHFDRGGVTQRVVKYTPGQSETFSITRGTPGYAGTTTTSFTIDASKADSTPLAQPEVYLNYGLRAPAYHGTPGASFAVHEGDVTGSTVSHGSFNPAGKFADVSQELKASTKYVIVQSIGSTTSAPVEFTTPAS